MEKKDSAIKSLKAKSLAIRNLGIASSAIVQPRRAERSLAAIEESGRSAIGLTTDPMRGPMQGRTRGPMQGREPGRRAVPRVKVSCAVSLVRRAGAMRGSVVALRRGSAQRGLRIGRSGARSARMGIVRLGHAVMAKLVAQDAGMPAGLNEVLIVALNADPIAVQLVAR